MPPSDRRQRLAWLIAGRAIVSTLLLGSGLLFQINSPGVVPVDPFFTLIGVTYAPDRRLRRRPARGRPAAVARRRPAGRRRLRHHRVHCRHRRRQQLLLAALRAADHRRRHAPPAAGCAHRGGCSPPSCTAASSWRSTTGRSPALTAGSPPAPRCRHRGWRSTPSRSTSSRSCRWRPWRVARREPAADGRPARARLTRDRRTSRPSTRTSSTASRAACSPPTSTARCSRFNRAAEPDHRPLRRPR